MKKVLLISLELVLAISVGLIGCGGEVLPEYSLTISSTEGGSVSSPGELGPYTYDEGEVVNLVAEAEEGYRFVNWTGDVGTVANVNDASTTITMNDDYAIVANFEERGEDLEGVELLMSVLTDVPRSTAHRYGAQDDHRRGLDTLKIIENSDGGYLGVYHSTVGGEFQVRLARSDDLMHWSYVATLEKGGHQPTITHVEQRDAYLVAFERWDETGSHLTFQYYEDSDSLLAANVSRTYVAPKTLAQNEGTPCFYSISPDLSEIVVGFHYFENLVADKVAMGWLSGFLTDNPSWTTEPRTDYNDGLISSGVHGNIGDRDYFWFHGHEYNLQEGQLISGDWASWRMWLYDHDTGDFSFLDIKTHGGSQAFGNGTVTFLKGPYGGDAVVITYFLFHEGSALGEAGQLIFYWELP